MYSIKTIEQDHKINIGRSDNAEYQIHYSISLPPSHSLPCKSDQIVFVLNLIQYPMLLIIKVV